MHFKDLTLYEYYLPFCLPNVLNVGWVGKDCDFAKGETPVAFLEKLETVLSMEGRFNARVNQVRGVHPCNVCGIRDYDRPFLGSCEIWIPGPRTGHYFAAPSLIVHYIAVHKYCPPECFVHSVLDLDLNQYFDAQKVYDELVAAQCR